MTEQGNGGAAPQQAPQVKMSVLTQFVRDMSFENILAQQGTGGEVSPDIQVGVSVDAKKRQKDHQYEVITKMNVASKDKGSDQNLFLLELEYVGVFHVEGVPEDQMHPFLMIECPRMLFPFLRRIVSDVTRDGGFPPLNLENIDWLMLYRNEIARRQQATQPAQTPDA